MVSYRKGFAFNHLHSDDGDYHLISEVFTEIMDAVHNGDIQPVVKCEYGVLGAKSDMYYLFKLQRKLITPLEELQPGLEDHTILFKINGDEETYQIVIFNVMTSGFIFSIESSYSRETNEFQLDDIDIFRDVDCHCFPMFIESFMENFPNIKQF